jgi:hypothetical protein
MMVQSDFGFDARLKSYRIFSSILCYFNHRWITGGVVWLPTCRRAQGILKRKERWSVFANLLKKQSVVRLTILQLAVN